MVFNELSIVNPATDKFQARELMSKLVQTLTTATKNGVQRTLRTGHTSMIFPLLLNIRSLIGAMIQK